MTKAGITEDNIGLKSSLKRDLYIYLIKWICHPTGKITKNVSWNQTNKQKKKKNDHKNIQMV